MSQKTITLHVDQDKLFDIIWATKDGGAALGIDLVGLLLSVGTPSVLDALRLAVYGVTLVSNDRIQERTNG